MAKAPTPDDNLIIWDAVEKTDPKYTKAFNRGGGFKGTATNPTYLAKKATEMFGPMGMGWGMEVLTDELLEGAPLMGPNGDVIGHEKIHTVLARLWYVRGDKVCHAGPQYGQTTFVGKNKHGLFTDEEAPKKSITDAMSKCLSLLGFAADIHLGKWDDNKYVNDRKAEEAQAEQEASGFDAKAWKEDVIKRLGAADTPQAVEEICNAEGETFGEVWKTNKSLAQTVQAAVEQARLRVTPTMAAG